MLLKGDQNLVALYFHGNGEDIYGSYDFLNNIRNNTGISIIAVEYVKK